MTMILTSQRHSRVTGENDPEMIVTRVTIGAGDDPRAILADLMDQYEEAGHIHGEWRLRRQGDVSEALLARRAEMAGRPVDDPDYVSVVRQISAQTLGLVLATVAY